MKTKSNIESILKNTFTKWYGENNAKVKEVKVKSIDFQTLRNDVNSKKSGEYIDQGIAYTGQKLKVVELPEMIGKEIWKVADYINKTYKDLPGLDVWQAIIDGKTNLPKDTWKWNYCFGSTLRDRGGRWSVPYLGWDGGSWSRGADWLGRGWGSSYRVVLLDDCSVSDPVASVNIESLASLELRVEKLEIKLEKISEILK